MRFLSIFHRKGIFRTFRTNIIIHYIPYQPYYTLHSVPTLLYITFRTNIIIHYIPCQHYYTLHSVPTLLYNLVPNPQFCLGIFFLFYDAAMLFLKSPFWKKCTISISLVDCCCPRGSFARGRIWRGSQEWNHSLQTDEQACT